MKNSWSSHYLFTVCALIASTLPTQAQVSAPCCTDFDDNSLHGWGPCPPPQDNVSVSLQSPGPSGNPGDMYFHARDLSGASLICAGNDCDGDWTSVAASGCASFCFDVRLDIDGDSSGPIETIFPTVEIRSGTLRARFTANQNITEPGGSNPGWHHICAPLALFNGGNLPSNSQGSWLMLDGAPNSSWNTLLSNVTDIQLPIDFTSNPAEEVSYDNFCLLQGSCSVAIPTLSTWSLVTLALLLIVLALRFVRTIG